MMGTSVSGTPTKASAVSLRLVTAIITMAPTPMTILRNANEADEPTTVCTKVVSAVSRESTSPVRVVSKNTGDSARIWL